MKLSGLMGNGPRKNPFNFDADQDKDLDPGILVLGDCRVLAVCILLSVILLVIYLNLFLLFFCEVDVYFLNQ